MNQDLTMSSISDDTSPLAQIEIDQRVFDLYDEYCTAAWTAASS
jgi:hypothetical protein